MLRPSLRWALAPFAAALIAPSATMADITPQRSDADAATLARAIATDPSVIDPAATTFPTIAPPSGDPDNPYEPAALSTTPLATFPRNGDSYAILTTGDPRLAPTANDYPGSGLDLGFADAARGPRVYDPLVWKVGLNVPADRNCLVVRFRFLSEEYPEFIKAGYNDAFVAELDNSTWSSDDAGIVSAPLNFAYDQQGKAINIDAAGAATVSDTNAAGTTYDGATRRLAAAKVVTPGAHALYLSIFDQGDHIYDSAAFVDDLQLLNVDPSRCTSGAFQDDAPPALANGAVANAPEPLVSEGQYTQDETPTFGGKAGITLNDDPKITGTIFSAASIRATAVSGTAVQSKTVAVGADGSWTMSADPLPEGSYVFQASQGSSNGQSTVTDPIHFSVDKTAPAPAISPLGYNGKTRDSTPLISGTAGTAGGDNPSLTVKLYRGKTATGAPLQTLQTVPTNGAWTSQMTAVKDGVYTATVEQGDAAGLSGSALRTFTVTTTNPIGKVKLAKRLKRAKAAKGLKGSLKFAFPGKVTFSLTAKIGRRTLKVGTVQRTLKAPGKVSFSIKPKRKVKAVIRRSRGTLTLKTMFRDDQGRTYKRVQKVRFR